jgi:hypothetical protein
MRTRTKPRASRSAKTVTSKKKKKMMSLEAKTNDLIVRTAYKEKFEHYRHILIGFATLFHGRRRLGDLLLFLAARGLLGTLLSLLRRLRDVRELALIYNKLYRGG